MTTRNLKRLNAYPEFRTDAGIDTVRTAVINQAPPAGLTPARAARFTARFLNPSWVVLNLPAAQRGGPGHGANRLRYRPPVPAGAPQINLLVAYQNERNNFMTRVWDDRRRGYGVGLQAFYHQVALSYLNIQKIHTDEFLTGKGDYQIQKTPHPKVISPIVTKYPNQRWGIDLIDMSVGPQANRTHRRYILTVVDYFSGYIWARYLTNNLAANVTNAMINICTTAPPGGSGNTYPTILQSDNGGEFQNAILAAWTNANNITHIFTQSYTPKSNGKVERKNREIRKKIKAGYLRNNNKVWIQHLPAYVLNINAQVSSRKNVSANQLWRPGHPPFPPLGASSVSLTPGRAAIIERRFLEQRARDWTHGALPRFQVGDNVRVDMFSLSSAYRKTVKERIINKLAVHWSPVVSTVIQVLPRHRHRRREMYAIAVGTPNGLPPNLGGIGPVLPLRRLDGRVWLFAGNQLTKAGDLVHLNPRTIPNADFMNSTN
jgi:hypothetical protein